VFKLLENGSIVHPPFFGVDLASTLHHEDQAVFGDLIAPSAATLYDAASRSNRASPIGPR
jgi:hypothetical protein